MRKARLSATFCTDNRTGLANHGQRRDPQGRAGLPHHPVRAQELHHLRLQAQLLPRDLHQEAGVRPEIIDYYEKIEKRFARVGQR